MKKKQDLILEVQQQTGYPFKEIKDITAVFLEVLMRAIAEEDQVQLSGFGSFRVITKTGSWSPTLKKAVNREVLGEQTVPHNKQHMVSFAKGSVLRGMIHYARGKPSEDAMDKYAVDEDVDQEDLEKKANDGCPECGRKVEKHGRTLMCPVHGTEPFESK